MSAVEKAAEALKGLVGLTHSANPSVIAEAVLDAVGYDALRDQRDSIQEVAAAVIRERDALLAENERLRVEYVPPAHWPADAWEPLLDAYFNADGDTARFGNYVLMRIPDEISARFDTEASP